jgi:hypothetical protein
MGLYVLPVRVRRACGASDLDAFVCGYEQASGYGVDPEYLSRAQVYVAVRAERVVGGFTLNVVPPFRTLLRVPEPERSGLSHEFPAADTVELTSVWLAPEARGTVASAVLWSNLVWHASRLRRRRAVFGTDVDRLRRVYERLRPTLLYEGSVSMDGVLGHGWVYTIPMARWPLALTHLATSSWGRR